MGVRQNPPLVRHLGKSQPRLEAIRQQRSEVVQELEQLRSRAHDMAAELDNLDRQKETTNRIVNELDRQIGGLSGQIDQITVDLLLAQDALEEKRAVAERRIVDISKRGPLYSYQVLLAAESLGALDWPVDGHLVYQFGTAAGPNNTRIPWHGIGIAAPVGTPVLAVASGTVTLAGSLGTYLTSVWIDHGGGYYTIYAYLQDATVAKGQRVLRGQIIGHVGGAPSDQGPHLHFELRGPTGGDLPIALDPLNWLKPRR